MKNIRLTETEKCRLRAEFSNLSPEWRAKTLSTARSTAKMLASAAKAGSVDSVGRVFDSRLASLAAARLRFLERLAGEVV
jgi:hypothetical protein